ncbi:hypothetical protein V5O48_002628 [Marasmius crinis-equi]|uniref:Transmembrane protein n=1 Tax=Marasmius crinis-equi TaxID=585013 RepID=A0ABR3FV14_9AGAR
MCFKREPGKPRRRASLAQVHKDYPTWTIFSSIIVVVIACLLALIFSIDFNGPVRENDALFNSDGKDGIVLIGHAFNLKLSERSMQIQWQPSACGAFYNSSQSPVSSNPRNGGKPAQCGRPNRKVSIFVDGDTDHPAWDYDPEKVPANGQGMQSGLIDSSLWFVTDTQVHMYTWAFPANKHTIGLDFLYPFLYYEMTHSFFGVSIEEEQPNNPNSTKLTPVPILDAVVVTATDNYTPGKFQSHSGLSVNFAPNTTTTSVRVPVFMRQFTLKMSTVAKAFSMILFIINWGLALLVTFMTVTLLVGKVKCGGKVPDSVLAMPLTIILMIPGLRALFIGNPPFGNVLDLTGFFPQMVLVGISSFVLLVLMGHDLRVQHEGPNSRRSSRANSEDDEIATLLKEKEELKVNVFTA